MSDQAIDVAARFGEIPFVDFTKDLVTGVFDTLLDAHIHQMEEYSDFISALSGNLSTYINETQDDVPFSEISGFIQNYALPESSLTSSTIETILNSLQNADNNSSPTITSNAPGQLNESSTWWNSLISNLAPAVTGLVDKIKDPTQLATLEAITQTNGSLINTAGIAIGEIPTYKQIHDAIAMMIVSNKYGLLQTMAKQGALRLVVTEGEIETRLTFSTWNNSSSGSNSSDQEKSKVKTKDKRGVFGRILKGRDKTKSRVVTVNTAQSYQRDSSGTQVDIFGRVLIKFKTDYAPLNG